MTISLMRVYGIAALLTFSIHGASGETMPLGSDRHLEQLDLQVQNYKKELRQKFLQHLSSPRNITTPIDTKEFPWRVNWKAQQKYCRSISEAIFRKKERMNLMLKPDAAMYRDSSDRVVSVVKSAFRECHKAELRGEVDATIKNIPKWTGSDLAVEYFASDTYFFEWTFDLSRKSSGFLYQGVTEGNVCPQAAMQFDGGPPGMERSLIPAKIDGNLTFLQFGTYTENFRLNSLTGYVGKRYGRIGQRFVFASGLVENIFDYWAPENEVYVNGVVMHPYGDRHLISCVINFD